MHLLQLLAFPICESLVYGQVHGTENMMKRSEHIVKFVEVIEGKLEELNVTRIVSPQFTFQ